MLTLCPRCNQNWSSSIKGKYNQFYFFACAICNIDYYYHGNNGESLYIKNFLITGDELCFFIETNSQLNYCEYFYRKMQTKIPLLPFNITAKKLQTYLTFI